MTDIASLVVKRFFLSESRPGSSTCLDSTFSRCELVQTKEDKKCHNRESNTGPQDDRILFSLALSQLSYCDFWSPGCETHIYIVSLLLHFSYTQTTPLPFTHSHTHIYKQTQTHVSTRFYSFIHTHIYTIYLLLLILPFNVHVIFDSLKIELINCLRVFIVTLLKIPLAGICFSMN